MSTIAYYLILPIIYGISVLPFWLLYRLSDLCFVLVYHVFGYRKQVVLTNLRNAFPDKSEQEIQHLSVKSYRYFCDLVLEVIKALTISPAQLRERVAVTGGELFVEYYRNGQSVLIVTGHFGNWEWGGARCVLEDLHKVCAIYHPLSNPHFDALANRMRARLGIRLFSMKEAIFGIMSMRNEITGTVFITDQNPSPRNVHWTRFLNQDTPVYKGTEAIARRLKYPVIYSAVKRTSRGHYCLHNELLVEKPAQTAVNEISELHTRRLEQDILEQPEIWLWTHRRWKHKRPASATGQKKSQ